MFITRGIWFENTMYNLHLYKGLDKIFFYIRLLYIRLLIRYPKIASLMHIVYNFKTASSVLIMCFYFTMHVILYLKRFK